MSLPTTGVYAVRRNGRYDPIMFGEPAPYNLRTRRRLRAVMRERDLGPCLTMFPQRSVPIARMYGPTLAAAYRRVRPAVATGLDRPVLRSVYVEVGRGVIGLTATDSYRLHHVEVPIAREPWNRGSVLVDARGLEAAVSMYPGEVELRSDGERLVFFNSGRMPLAVPPVSGEYPNYRLLSVMIAPAMLSSGQDHLLGLLRTLGEVIAVMRIVDGQTEIRAASSVASFPPVWEGEWMRLPGSWNGIGENRVFAVWAPYLADLIENIGGPVYLQDGDLRPIVCGSPMYGNWGLVAPYRLPEATRRDVLP